MPNKQLVTLMTETLFLQLKNNRRITLPADTFKEGDLVMIKKVTKVEMNNFMIDLKRKAGDIQE